MTSLDIRPLAETDIPEIVDAFARLGWPGKDTDRYQRYLRDQENDDRPFLLARADGEFAGYVTVNWRSPYAPFREAGIPEIQDLNVLEQFRRMHIATELMDRAEALIKTRSPIAGLGVGLYVDYGAAQTMYVRRGYVPDAQGIVYDFQPIEPGAMVRLDDDLTLMMTRRL